MHWGSPEQANYTQVVHQTQYSAEQSGSQQSKGLHAHSVPEDPCFTEESGKWWQSGQAYSTQGKQSFIC
jgi:hypothetical protein